MIFAERTFPERYYFRLGQFFPPTPLPLHHDEACCPRRRCRLCHRLRPLQPRRYVSINESGIDLVNVLNVCGRRRRDGLV